MFKTTANSIKRKRSLNELLTNEQITNIQNQNKNKRKKRKTNAVLTEQSTNIQEQNTNIQEQYRIEINIEQEQFQTNALYSEQLQIMLQKEKESQENY